jgi:hypothetical protein
MTQQYCAIFHFVHGLQQINMLSNTDAACVANAVAMCLKKEKENSPLDQRMAETKTTIHTQKLMTGLRASEPNDYNIFWVSTVHHSMGYSRLLSLQLL